MLVINTFNCLLFFSTLFFIDVTCQDVKTFTTSTGILTCPVDKFGDKIYFKCLAVPYAKPPINENRFKLPKPLDPSSDQIDCSKPAPLCKQVVDGGLPIPGELDDKIEKVKAKEPCGGMFQMTLEIISHTSFSEDCLYMNIFGPDVAADAKLPVLVFFHGGMFSAGGANLTQYNPSILATEQQVIVVVPQYRLGVLGFLYSGTPEAPGNMGIWDQRQALIWVKENIDKFGGNPELVTIAGHDAGGWSVGLHYMSKVSQDLFAHAIMIDGGPLSLPLLFSEASAIDQFERYCDAVGAPLPEKVDGAETRVPNEETWKYLAEVDFQTLSSGVIEILMSKKSMGFMVVPAGEFVSNTNPFDSVKDGEIPSTKPVLIGTTAAAGAIFVASAANDIYPLLDGEPQPKTLPELIEKLKENAGQNAGQMQMMVPMFFRGIDQKDPVKVRERCLDLAKDGIWVCPDSMFISAANKAGAKIFVFSWEYRPSCSIYAPWIDKATHMDIQSFTFGQACVPGTKFSEKDCEISKEWMARIAAFMRTGNPSIEGGLWHGMEGKKKGYAIISDKFDSKKGVMKNLCKDLNRYYSMIRSFLKTYKPANAS